MTLLTRRHPWGLGPMRDIMDWVNTDPFLSSIEFKPLEEGTLPLDVSEKDGELFVRASMPGFTREDIEVQIHEGVLTIKAERTEEKEDKDEKFFRRERRVGSVYRSVSLPGITDGAKTIAELKDGVLTLRIPQAEAAKPRKIQIK